MSRLNGGIGVHSFGPDTASHDPDGRDGKCGPLQRELRESAEERNLNFHGSSDGYSGHLLPRTFVGDIVTINGRKSKGTTVARIYTVGLSAPKAGAAGNVAVLGGTGAFLGARGQAATIMNTYRSTSTFENPINRRTFPSGLWKIVVQLIPMTTPEVALTATGPAVVHSSDFSLVTAAKPAHAGEVLTLFASGLGPTPRR
jgi:hypothetical protein